MAAVSTVLLTAQGGCNENRYSKSIVKKLSRFFRRLPKNTLRANCFKTLSLRVFGGGYRQKVRRALNFLYYNYRDFLKGKTQNLRLLI